MNRLLLLALLAGCGPDAPHGSGHWIRGDAHAPAAEALAQVDYQPRPADFSSHPDLPGLLVSHNTVTLTFADDATVADVNRLGEALGGRVVGSYPGLHGVSGGFLTLRFASADHGALRPILRALETDPAVALAVPDVALGTAEIPMGTGAPGWTWETTPTGANANLEQVRAPGLWNLNDAVWRSGRRSRLGIVDVGFSSASPSLDLDVSPVKLGTSTADHAAHVTGIAAATYDNGIGIDGVTAHADVYVTDVAFHPMDLVSWTELLTVRLPELARWDGGMDVVNTSLGFNWGRLHIDASTDAVAQGLAFVTGSQLMAQLRMLEAGGTTFQWVTAAGNDSDDISVGGELVVQRTEYASPMANAAARGLASIVVVEAVDQSDARAPFSNLGGHVSAPGVGIWSLTAGGGTGVVKKSGTSMAAPHVAGLLSTLYALEPELRRPTTTRNEVRDLLLAGAHAATGGAAPRIDAWATLITMDDLTGRDTALRGLLDVDDGTLDGNDRRTAVDARCDGEVDMADFRRFRDWLLDVEGAPGLDLDGPADHGKRDLNRDGVVDAIEGVYPRGDFNGDGLLSRTAQALVPGVGPLTDLEVFQLLFDDADAGGVDLERLLDSGDVHVDATGCLGDGVTEVTLIVDGEALEVVAAEAPLVVTAPAGQELRLEIHAADAEGNLVGSESATFTPTLGGDEAWRPTCETPCPVHVDPTADPEEATGAIDAPMARVGDALAARGSCDEVVLLPGTYVEAMTIDDSVTVRSTDGAAATLVTWDGPGRVLTIANTSGVVVEGLTVTGGTGGGVQVDRASAVEIRDAVISHNVADFGGGLYCGDSALTVTGTRFEHNRALRSSGGLRSDGCVMELVGNTFEANDGGENGGGMSIEGGQARVWHNTFLNNSALVGSGDGGGLAASGNAEVDIANNWFEGGDVEDNGGGARLYDASGRFVNNVMRDNKIGLTLGGACTVAILNNTIVDSWEWGMTVGYEARSLVMNNTISDSGRGGVMFWEEGVYLTWRHNNVRHHDDEARYVHRTELDPDDDPWNERTGQDGNLSVDPGFTGGGLDLAATSALVDAGADVAGWGVVDDFDGQARPSGAGFDIGAYEY